MGRLLNVAGGAREKENYKHSSGRGEVD